MFFSLPQLPFRVRWQDVKDLFRGAGTVLRADVALSYDNRSKGHGTVLFSSVEDAQRAIDKFHNYRWHGRILEIREDRSYVERNASDAIAGDQPQHDSEQSQDRENDSVQSLLSPDQGVSHLGRQLFIGNLPFGAQWQDIKDLFRPAGRIIRADVAQDYDGRSRGFGTVLFASPDDADKAIDMYDGYEYQGRRLRVHHDKFAINGSHIQQQRRFMQIQPKYTTLEFNQVPDAAVLESLKQTYGNLPATTGAMFPGFPLPPPPAYPPFAGAPSDMAQHKPEASVSSSTANTSTHTSTAGYYAAPAPPHLPSSAPYDFMSPYPAGISGYYGSPSQQHQGTPPPPHQVPSGIPVSFDLDGRGPAVPSQADVGAQAPPSSTFPPFQPHPHHPHQQQQHHPEAMGAAGATNTGASPFFLPPGTSPASHLPGGPMHHPHHHHAHHHPHAPPPPPHPFGHYPPSWMIPPPPPSTAASTAAGAVPPPPLPLQPQQHASTSPQHHASAAVVAPGAPPMQEKHEPGATTGTVPPSSAYMPYDLYQHHPGMAALADGMQRMGLADASAGLTERGDNKGLAGLPPAAHLPSSQQHPPAQSENPMWNFQL
ncbi:hypothetical protein BC940DRAFT_62940 [Gongronella butleri]|nr:hypothetical protein BC940DRAFT_62940 [Gongronella butleri]